MNILCEVEYKYGDAEDAEDRDQPMLVTTTRLQPLLFLAPKPKPTSSTNNLLSQILIDLFSYTVFVIVS